MLITFPSIVILSGGKCIDVNNLPVHRHSERSEESLIISIQFYEILRAKALRMTIIKKLIILYPRVSPEDDLLFDKRHESPIIYPFRAN